MFLLLRSTVLKADLFALAHDGLGGAVLLLAAQHGAGALVAGVALLEGGFGARRQLLAGRGGGGGEDQGLQRCHFCLQDVDLRRDTERRHETPRCHNNTAAVYCLCTLSVLCAKDPLLHCCIEIF